MSQKRRPVSEITTELLRAINKELDKKPKPDISSHDTKGHKHLDWLNPKMLLNDSDSSLRDLINLGEGAGRIRQVGRLAFFREMAEKDQLVMQDNFFGLAFVVCQQYITFIVSKAILINDYCKDKNILLDLRKHSKAELLMMDSQFVQNTEITKVQAIDALANYYKHQDEWTGSWKKLKGQSVQTAQTLLRIGINQDSNTPFRDGYVVITDTTDITLARLAVILRSWGDAVGRLYTNAIELKKEEFGMERTIRPTFSRGRNTEVDNFVDLVNYIYSETSEWHRLHF